MLNSDQLLWLRRKVGSSPDDATLNELYAELDTIEEVAAQIIEQRLADVTANPTTLSIPDEVSLSNIGRASDLRRALNALGTAGASIASIVPPKRRVRR